MALIRSSIILLYIRIFSTRPFRFTCYAVLALNGAACIANILVLCLVCNPITWQWDIVSIRRVSSCYSQLHLLQISTVANLILDVTVVVLPTPVLWGLQMAISKKVTVQGMFGLGFL